MKRERVIVTSLLIERKNQIKLFQIKLPYDTKSIIGVEIGTRMIDTRPWEMFDFFPEIPLEIRRNMVVGDVKLQSYEQSNVFYSGEVTLSNKNMDYGDYANYGLWPQEFTNQMHAHETPVHVSGETAIIQGIYKDKTDIIKRGDTTPDFLKYMLKVYVWVELKEKQNKK